MKKYLINPHVLLIGFFLMIIVGLSPTVKAQEERKITRSIIITNGDTIINGKKLSEAKKEERARLRKEIQEMNNGISSENSVIIKKGKSKEPLVLEWKDNPDEYGLDSKTLKQPDLRFFKFNGKDLKLDSLLDGFGFKIDGLDSNFKDRVITMRRNLRPGNPELSARISDEESELKRAMLNRESRKNSYLFTYNYTDQDGIPSRMNIRMSEIEKENIEKITASKDANTDLKIEDLTFFPNFSSGKLGISFNSNTGALLNVKILNSEFKQVFSDDASVTSGNYSKQISLPKNGIYYIAIKQNNSWFLRKFIKS